ncbi:MAG TPA: isocitrate/isopropylmalate family dehydrogenase [Actinomycetota bacterium]
MGSHRITLIPGDGSGPEIVDAARRAVEATGVRIDWDVQPAGADAVEREGTPLPERLLGSIRVNRVALKGPLAAPADGARSANVALRTELDLYAGVRPSRSFPGAPSRYRDVDVVVIRENTEGSYTGVEFEQGAGETAELLTFVERTTGGRVREDSGLSIKAISVGASRRIARFAFAYVRAEGRRRVTAGHKANIMKMSDGLFLETVRQVAAEHPDVAFEDRIIDNLTMQLVQRPEAFDVLLLPNLYADIVSDLCAGLVGGLGLAPGANIGDDCAVFEARPSGGRQGRADPLGLMLSGAMMLRHLGEREAAHRLEEAVAHVIADGRSVTPDLKLTPDDPSAVGTTEVADAVVGRLRAGPASGAAR